MITRDKEVIMKKQHMLTKNEERSRIGGIVDNIFGSVKMRMLVPVVKKYVMLRDRWEVFDGWKRGYNERMKSVQMVWNARIKRIEWHKKKFNITGAEWTIVMIRAIKLREMIVESMTSAPMLWIPGRILITVTSAERRLRVRDIIDVILRLRERDEAAEVTREEQGMINNIWGEQALQLYFDNRGYRTYIHEMLDISLVLGLIACWEMTPQWILQIDPAACIDPALAQGLKDSFPEGIGQIQENVAEGIHEHKTIQQGLGDHQANMTTEESRHRRKMSLAIVLVAALTGILINGLTGENLIEIAQKIHESK